MKKILLFALGCALLLPHGVRQVAASGTAAEPSRVTLYSPNRYRHDSSRALFSFQRGALAGRGESWDVAYGLLSVGDYHDWFSASSRPGSRSVIRNMGALDWNDSLTVPVVEPLPVLKVGEKRVVTIDSSCADGRDGAPGADGKRGADGRAGADGADGGGGGARAAEPKESVPESIVLQSKLPPLPPPAPPRREPKVDPMFVKAIVGHMYVIHVVDDGSDYYALFRVEALERGDNCTIKWKVVPAPVAQASRN